MDDETSDTMSDRSKLRSLVARSDLEKLYFRRKSRRSSRSRQKYNVQMIRGVRMLYSTCGWNQSRWDQRTLERGQCRTVHATRWTVGIGAALTGQLRPATGAGAIIVGSALSGSPGRVEVR